jgi:hypothetical protein
MWTFTANQGDALQVDIAEVGTNTVFVPEIRLLRPDGALVSTTWGDVSAEIKVAAPLTGTYTVFVSRRDIADGTGSYLLTTSHGN